MSDNLEKLREFDLELPPPIHRGLITNNLTRSQATRQNEKTEDQLFALYQSNHALVETVDRAELFFWTGEISNSSLDTWFTRMAQSTLQNYAADAVSPSVSFQDSHARAELGVGRSLWGELVETGTAPAPLRNEDYFPVVFADFFTVRDMKLGKMGTDDFIKGVQRGVIKDLSIGFKEGIDFQYTCSVCGEDMWDWDCPHIPGQKYEATENPNADPSIQRTTEQLCFAWIENARLSEVSAVYDGATTNAMIVKATREARAGRLDRNTKEFLEHRYRFTLDTGRKLWTGVDMLRHVVKETFNKPEDADLLKAIETRVGVNLDPDKSTKEQRAMSEEKQPAGQGGTVPTSAPDYTMQFRQACVDLAIEINPNASALECLTALRSEVTKLRPMAIELGELRKVEIDEAVKERVRAIGEGVDEDKTRKMLANADISTIREFQTEWRTAGDTRLKPNGKNRNSEDPDSLADDGDDKGGDERKPATGGRNPSVPASAYGGV